MKKLVNFSELGFEAVNAALVSTRSYLAQNRDTTTRFLRALVRGMHRYSTDKEFSKRVLGKYFRSNDDQILEASWKDVAPNLSRVAEAVGESDLIHHRRPVQRQKPVAETGKFRRHDDRR